ncbi:MAG: gliding motility-associated C-terminal domain-containing protein [Bacteroidetes bacterium]|nr:gliding motility-associated C-terminal domain-containing protein [Bacteroidota bacterium]
MALHTIMTTPSGNNNPSNGAIVGYDPICRSISTGLYDLPLLYPGSNVSVRLGNAVTGTSGGIAAMMSYSMNVTATNSQFTYKYAAVLSDGYHSTPGMESFFSVKLKDGSGNILGGNCGKYYVNAVGAANGTDPTFKLSNVSGVGGTVYYKNWSSITIDLTAYIGQTVNIVFEVADCIYQVHFGYVYLSLDCGQLQMPSSNYCTGSTSATLVAPGGFTNYQWQGPNNHTNIPGATSDKLVVNNPTVNDTFYVQVTNVSGCISVLKVVIENTNSAITVVLQSVTAACSGLKTGAISIINNPAYTYTWSSGAGVTGTTYGTSTSITGLTAGIIYLRIQNGACNYRDTSFIIPSSANPMSTQNKKFCSSSGVWLNAGNGNNYKWYDGTGSALPPNNNDSLLISNPLNNAMYFVSYNNSGGCKDSIRFILNESVISVTQQIQNNPCQGANTASIHLSSSPTNVYTYTWTGPAGYTNTNTGSTSVINNLYSGNYTCFISDNICSKAITIPITEPTGIPDTLAISVSFCDLEKEATLKAPKGYSNYQWYLSNVPVIGAHTDSLHILDPVVNYMKYTVRFTIPPCTYQNKTFLKLDKATNIKMEEVNVFSPNGDDINDTFFPFIDKLTLGPLLSDYLSSYYLEIYSRWGEKIYESNNASQGWDGKYNGNYCNDGVYFWILKYTLSCGIGTTENKNGFVTLLK